MRKITLLMVFSLLIWSCKSTKETGNDSHSNSTITPTANPTDYANTITSAELKEMLYVFASDEFKGRNTGEEGEKKAVSFLKQFYISQEIPSAVKSGSFEQNVPLNQLYIPEIEVEANGHSFQAFEHIVSLSSSVTATVEDQEIVYVGYGVDHKNYSDYKTIDVKGKIVIAKSGEPKNDDGTYLISGTTDKSKWSNGRQGRSSKKTAAAENGAKAFIFIDDYAFNYYSKVYKRRHDSGSSIGLSLESNDDQDILYFLASESVGETLVEDMMRTATPKVIPSRISVGQKSKSKKINSSNVVAFIKGSEKPEEYVIISAHLDHLGVGTNGEVYNGADDDGSGTIAILEIAEAFKEAEKNGHTPKRSIVFLHITGEEKGLLGSRYYTDHDPLFPLEQTVANLNLDMVGRTDPKRTEGTRNYIYLIGSDKLSTDLHNLSEEINSKYTNIELDYKYNDDEDPNRFYYRSDHYNFAKNNIPIIFYFNGSHGDYHQSGDTADKIQYDLLENRARLVFYTAWEVANREQRISVDKAEEAISGNK